MEQTLTERQSQEQYITGGGNFTQNKAHIPLCRDNIRGTCANGASCKYRHVDIGKHNGARGLGNSQLHKRINNYDSRTRFTNGSHRSKSPCRDFLRGTCIFGSKCRRLHPVNIEGHQDATLRASRYCDGSNMDNPWRTGNIPGNFRTRLPCRDFFSGKCYRGESCFNLHPFPRYNTTRYCLGKTELHGFQASSGTSHFNDGVVGPISRVYQNGNGQRNDAGSTKDGLELTSNREPGVCLMFNQGKCNFGDSCLYLHCYHKTNMKLNNVGQNGQKCQLPEEKFEGISSRPFKRQRSYNSRMDLGQDGYSNVVSFQFPRCHLNTFERPIYHANSYDISTGLCENYDSKSVNEGLQIESPSKKDETLGMSVMENCSRENTRERGQGTELCEEIGKENGYTVNEGLQIESPSKKDETLGMSVMENCSQENNRERGLGTELCEEIGKENGYIIETIKKNVGPTLAMTEVSRRKLLVLDVNGILADIVSEYPKCCLPGITVSKQGVFKRPFCDEFLQFCFERYNVGIWSSRITKNVTKVVNFLLKDTQNKLLFCWDQSRCTMTGYKTLENTMKPLVLKELKNLWDNKWGDLPWEKGYYNETNTVLLDDSPYKALRNPPYTSVFPHPYSCFNKEDKSLGSGGDIRVYLEKLAEAENVQKFVQENPFGQNPITKSNLSWAFYAKIVGP